MARVTKGLNLKGNSGKVVSYKEVHKPTVSTNSILSSTGIEPGTDITVDLGPHNQSIKSHLRQS